MAMPPGISVLVEFYSRFSGRKGEIPLSHTGDTAVPVMQTYNDLSLSQYLYVGL